MDIVYFEARFQDSVEKAESEVNCCARRAHQGLARLYREKLSLLRADARDTGTSPRARLSADSQ